MCLKVAPATVAFVQDGPRVVRVGVGINEDRESVGVVAEAAEVPPDFVVRYQDVRPKHRLGLERSSYALGALEQLRPGRHQGRLKRQVNIRCQSVVYSYL